VFCDFDDVSIDQFKECKKKKKRREDKKEWLVFLRPSKKTTKGVYVVLFLPINNSPPLKSIIYIQKLIPKNKFNQNKKVLCLNLIIFISSFLNLTTIDGRLSKTDVLIRGDLNHKVRLIDKTLTNTDVTLDD